jgi:RNA polymerase sigma-70 factor (ECF subfamily)
MNQAEHDMLVLAAQDGGRQAFQLLVRHHHRSLLRFALSLCGHRALAQDAVQDAWITVARRLRRLEDPRAFRSWVFRAVRWRVLDLQRSGRASDARLDDIDEPGDDGSAGDANERRLDLAAAIEALSPIDRHALELHYLAGLKVAEIARVLEIPPGTVKSRLHRARNQLAQILDGDEQ